MQWRLYNKEIIWAFLVGFFVLFLFYVLNIEIFYPIGKNILDGSGDGLKNLYTFGYYLKYGKGLFFNGMLYPFGEHITYVDAQPLYVWLIWLVESIFHFKIENPIIYIHLIVLLNIYFATFFVFLILKHFKVSFFVAFVGTVVIVLLSPQIYRNGDHFALASVVVIPFFWWWRLQITTSNTNYFFYAVTLSLVGFIHPYLLFMVVLLLLSYEFVLLLFYKNKRWHFVFPILAFLLFYGIILYTDTITDRPKAAWGAKAFSCNWYDLLLPINGVVKDFFIRKIPSIIPFYTEGHAYITVFGIFILLISFFYLIRHIYTHKNIKIKRGSIEFWLLAATPILIFAFYIPFRWNEEFFSFINPFKQFRGTGRFIFVFYYVYMVYVFVCMDRLYHKVQYPIFKIIFWFCCLITIYDIYNASNYLKYRFDSYGNKNAYNSYKDYTDKLTSKIKNKSDYESIIVYPPSTEGTEKLWIDNDWNAKISSYWVSYFTGLPMVNVHSSRVSFDNCMQIFQLSGFYTMPKPIVQKFNPNKKQLVLLKTDRLNDDVPLVQNATFIDSINDIALLEIDLNSININKNKRVFWVDSSYTLLERKSYKKGNKLGLFINQTTNILALDLTNKKFNKLRILFWYTPNYYKTSSVPVCSLYYIDAQNKEHFIKDWRESHTDTYNYKDGWLCVDYELNIENNFKQLRFMIDGKQIYLSEFRVYGK
ncbi:MAG TPA: hypothetical protein PLC61_00650 [Chitinophagales bacterium]|nr:hypothetical protein [Chitinophagales bacterium]HMU97193.1 hypothetical protein [Chitinophagales bacterium]HMV02409.1 hypothetical protein [Chitinophagales bacterium]HMW94009.1 hypothetical protein [Chitinophagales bacterium]HMY41781.1 hypothetical protein [Chitinophagales bacterium]